MSRLSPGSLLSLLFLSFSLIPATHGQRSACEEFCDPTQGGCRSRETTIAMYFRLYYQSESVVLERFAPTPSPTATPEATITTRTRSPLTSTPTPLSAVAVDAATSGGAGGEALVTKSGGSQSEGSGNGVGGGAESQGAVQTDAQPPPSGLSVGADGSSELVVTDEVRREFEAQAGTATPTQTPKTKSPTQTQTSTQTELPGKCRTQVTGFCPMTDEFASLRIRPRGSELIQCDDLVLAMTTAKGALLWNLPPIPLKGRAEQWERVKCSRAIIDVMLLNITLKDGQLLEPSAGAGSPPIGTGFVPTCNDEGVCKFDADRPCIGGDSGKNGYCARCPEEYNSMNVEELDPRIFVSFFGTDSDGKRMQSGNLNPLRYREFSLGSAYDKVRKAGDRLTQLQPVA